MKTYIKKIEVFDGEYFPNGVTYNLAPITLFGGSNDGLYLYEAMRSLCQLTVFKHIYDLTRVITHREDEAYCVEFFENEEATSEFDTSKIYCNGEEIVDLHDERFPLINSQRVIDECKDYDYKIKDTKVHWIPSMLQKCNRHPRLQWEYINEKVLQAKEDDLQLLIEANSDVTYNAIRILIKEKKIDPKDVIVHYFAMDKKLGEKKDDGCEYGYCGDVITFDENGNPSQMVCGLLSTYEKQLEKLKER